MYMYLYNVFKHLKDNIGNECPEGILKHILYMRVSQNVKPFCTN